MREGNSGGGESEGGTNGSILTVGAPGVGAISLGDADASTLFSAAFTALSTGESWFVAGTRSSV